MHVLGFYLPYIYLIGFALAAALMVALYYMLYRTKFGRAVRASLQNRTSTTKCGPAPTEARREERAMALGRPGCNGLRFRVTEGELRRCVGARG